MKILLNLGVTATHGYGVETNSSYTNARERVGCDVVVIVGSRLSNDSVYCARELDAPDIDDALPFRREISELAVD